MIFKLTFKNVSLVLDFVFLIFHPLSDLFVVINHVLSHPKIITDSCLRSMVDQRSSKQLKLKYETINIKTAKKLNLTEFALQRRREIQNYMIYKWNAHATVTFEKTQFLFIKKSV